MDSVKYMNDVKFMNDIKFMNDVKYMNDVTLMPDVSGLHNVTPYSGYRPRRVTVVDDSYEKADSLLDVILGSTQRNELLKEEGWEWAENIPLLNMVVGTGALLKDKYFDPVYNAATGEESWGQAGKDIVFNTLNEISEDLDVFSNIVKSQFSSAGGGNGLQDLRDALGLDGRRKVYNFNTGNTFKDIGLEIISDPLNWFTFGASALEKAGGKTAAETTTKTVLKESAQELTEQQTKALSKAIVKDVAVKQSDDLYETVLKSLGKKTRNEILQEISEETLRQTIDEASQTILKNADNYRLFLNASKIHHGVEAVDKAIAKTAYALTPVLPAKVLAKEVLVPTIKSIYNTLVSNLKKYNLEKHFISNKGVYQSALSSTFLQNKAINETVFRDNYNFLRSIDLDDLKIQELYHKMLKELGELPDDFDNVETFKEYLLNHVEKFAYNSKIDADFASYVNSQAFDNLINTVSAGPLAVYAVEQNLVNADSIAKIQSMYKYVNDHKDDLAATYYYVDHYLLKHGERKYSLSTLNNFLHDIQMDKSVPLMYKEQLSSLLSSLGININNAEQLHRVVINERLTPKGKAKQIKQILETTNTGVNLKTAKDNVQMMSKRAKQINDTTNNVLDRVIKDKIATHNIDLYEEVINEQFKNIKDAIEYLKGHGPFKLGDTSFKGIPVKYDLTRDVGASINLKDNVINVNKEKLRQIWKSKSWRNPVRSAPFNYDFQDFNELVNFVMLHEYAHKYTAVEKLFDSTKPFDLLSEADKALYKARETAVNEEALRLLKLQKERAADYIQNVIRLQDLPNLNETIGLINQAISTSENILNPKMSPLRQHHITKVESFFKLTEKIRTKINRDGVDASFDIIKWWQELDDVDTAIKKLQQAFTKNGSLESIQTRDTLKLIQNSLSDLKTKAFKDNIVNYVDDIQGMLMAQLSHYGMFNVLTQHTHLSDNKRLNLFLSQLVDTESVYRKNYIPDLIKSCADAGRPGDVVNINKVMAQVDTVTNLNNLLATDFVVDFKMSNKLQQDFKRILVDTIDNNSYHTIADILSEDVTHQGYTSYIAGEEALTLKQSIKETINYKVEHTQTLINNLIKENPDLNVSDMVTEIEEQLHNMFDNYVNKQAAIGDLNKIDNIALSTLYDTNTVKTLKSLSNIRYDLARNTNLTVQTLKEYDILAHDFMSFARGIQAGIDDIKKWDQMLSVPISYADATKLLKEFCEQYNLYSASIESSMFTTKYLNKNSYNITNKLTGEIEHIAGLNEMFKLDKSMFKGSNEEFLMITEKLWSYRDILHEEYKYKKNYLDKLKIALTNTYKDPTALFAPNNPYKYFNSLDAEQLLAWESATKSNLSIKNKTKFYTEFKKATQGMDLEQFTKSDFLAELDVIMRNAPFTNDNAIAHMASIAKDADTLTYANSVIEANFMSTLHSLDDLGTYRDKLNQFLQDDVDVHKDIVDNIIRIENDPTLRDTFDPFTNPKDAQVLSGAKIGYEDAAYKNQITMYQERSASLAKSIVEMDAEELATHVYRQTPGAMVFRNTNINKVLNEDGTITWVGFNNPFNFTDEELKEAGLKIMKETNTDGDWYYIRLTDDRVHNKIPKYAALGTEYQHVQEQFTDLIDKYRSRLNLWETEDVPSNLLKVETLNEDTWNKFLDAHIDFFGTNEERKLYQKLTPQGHSSFFNKSFSRLNLAVVGGYDTYNLWNKIYSDDFITRSMQMSRNTLAGMTSLINRSNKITKYLTMFFNNDWSLENPLIKKMFSEADDARIKEFFTEDGYTIAILRQDKKGLPKVFEYSVTNRKSLDKAIAAGGILVPRETYTAMKSVVNNRLLTNDAIDLYRRIVPNTYKTMYLYTAGFPFRNALDSLIYKNTNELGGITHLPEVFKYEYEASKAIKLHNKIQQEVFDLTGGETFNKETLLKVLEKHSKEEIEVYFLTDLFMESAASSGTFSKAMGNFLETYNKTKVDELRYLWEVIYEDRLLHGDQWYNPLHNLAELNDHIEITARMGLFLASVDAGMPVPDAIARVVKTHFDYSSGHDLIDICEKVFWFSTFPINNFNYYMNGGLTKSPTMLRLVMDTQTSSWNNGEYTYEELKKTNFLAYHAMTGNIRIGNWIVKTSPSIFDFMNLAVNPVENLKDRLNPFLSLPMNMDNLGQELNPMQTQFRLFPKQLDKEHWNPVPSILSRINDYDWDRTFFKWHGYNKSGGTWTHYPKIKKPNAYIKYVRKYYSRRYRTDVRKVSRTSLYHDAVNYYRIGGRRRGITYRDL